MKHLLEIRVFKRHFFVAASPLLRYVHSRREYLINCKHGRLQGNGGRQTTQSCRVAKYEDTCGTIYQSYLVAKEIAIVSGYQ